MYTTTVTVPHLDQEFINRLEAKRPGIMEFLPLIETAKQAETQARVQYDDGLDSDFSFDYVTSARATREGNTWNVELQVSSADLPEESEPLLLHPHGTGQ